MKCSCDAELSFSSEARHLVMNSYGVMGAFSLAHEDDRLPREGGGLFRFPPQNPADFGTDLEQNER